LLIKGFKLIIQKIATMTLKEAYPDYELLHLMQPRLDKAGHIVEQFIQRVIDEGIHGHVPEEIKSRGIETTVRFIGEFGWSRVGQYLMKLYP